MPEIHPSVIGNSSHNFLTFSSELLRKTKHPEKRQFIREKIDAYLLVNGRKYKIADISVSGLKLEEKLQTKRDEILSVAIVCGISGNIYRQKSSVQVTSDPKELQTRFSIIMNIGLPERIQAFESVD